MADFEEQFIEDDEEEYDSDNSLALQMAKTPDNSRTFRPTLADEQKIGFFSLDRTTQTELSEVADIKELTDNINQLLQDSGDMRKDINFARNVMQAEFEAKLQQKSLDLYQRVNDQITDIEKLHADRVATVRRAFRQQLADALVRMHSHYNKKNIDQRLEREKRKKNADAGKYEQKFKDMQATIQRNESIIHMLKMQLAQAQEKEPGLFQEVNYDLGELESEPDDRAAPRRPEVEVPPPKSPSIDGNEEVINELKGDIHSLEKKIGRIEEAYEMKEEENKELHKEIEKLNDEVEKGQIMIEQLKHEKEELEHESENNQQSMFHHMENQRRQMEEEMMARIKQARQDALQEAKKELQGVKSQESEKMKKLLNEKQQLMDQLQQPTNKSEKKPEKKREKKPDKEPEREREKAISHNKDAIDLDKAKETELRLQAEVTKLKREIDRVHRTWEKKFAILQQSLHALKDESFLRQTMQRQAAQLHNASISYAYDAPMGIAPDNPNRKSNKKNPLPGIGKSKGRDGRPGSPPDYISYTVSAPSRGATIFSVDDNQIMSDTEQDLPADVNPLPPPPGSRSNMTDCGEESRPSTRSHVVVLPSAEVQ